MWEALNTRRKDQSTAKNSNISASYPGPFGFSADKELGMTYSAHGVSRLCYRAAPNIVSIVLPNNVDCFIWIAAHFCKTKWIDTRSVLARFSPVSFIRHVVRTCFWPTLTNAFCISNRDEKPCRQLLLWCPLFSTLQIVGSSYVFGLPNMARTSRHWKWPDEVLFQQLRLYCRPTKPIRHLPYRNFLIVKTSSKTFRLIAYYSSWSLYRLKIENIISLHELLTNWEQNRCTCDLDICASRS